MKFLNLICHRFKGMFDASSAPMYNPSSIMKNNASKKVWTRIHENNLTI